MHSAGVMYAKAALLLPFVLVVSVEGLSGRDCVQHAAAGGKSKSTRLEHGAGDGVACKRIYSIKINIVRAHNS